MAPPGDQSIPISVQPARVSESYNFAGMDQKTDYETLMEPFTPSVSGHTHVCITVLCMWQREAVEHQAWLVLRSLEVKITQGEFQCVVSPRTPCFASGAQSALSSQLITLTRGPLMYVRVEPWFRMMSFLFEWQPLFSIPLADNLFLFLSFLQEWQPLF